jgi:protease-4
MSEEFHEKDVWSPGNIAIWVLVPLVLGILVAFLWIPRPVIGLIYLNDAIYPYTSQALVDQITYARQTPKIRGVLLVLDSPGGTVSDTEAVYLELARLRAVKPVVTYVKGMAASGAYYLSVGTDGIYANPSSQVGNVGVIAQLPPPPYLSEDIATTGPYKMTGTTRDQLLREMEMIKDGFYQAVTLGRGDALKIGPEVLLRGQIWPGSEALRLGLIDGLRSQSEAVEEVARRAKVRNYQVADLRALSGYVDVYEYPFFLETEAGLIMPYPKEPGVFLLYIPPTDRRLP